MRFVPTSLIAILIPLNASLAQLTGALSLGGGVGQLGASAWTRETRLSPALRVTNAFGALSLDGIVAERAGAVALDQAALAGLITTPALGPFRLGADASYTRSRDLTAAAHIAPSVSVKRGPMGAWFGSAHDQQSGARLQAGVWTSLRSAIFSLSSRTQDSFARSIHLTTVSDSTP